MTGVQTCALPICAGRACPAFWTTQRADDLAAIAERLRLATEDTNAPATNRQPERTENVEVSFYQEPQVGIEPTTARLRIECSTTELLWRDPARAMDRRVTRMPWLGFEPRRLSAPPPQDGVSTSFTTRARITSIVRRRSIEADPAVLPAACLPTCEPMLPAGATGLEPATSRVTVECSNQTELRPLNLHDSLPSPPRRPDSPNGSRTRLCTLKGCRPNR